MSFATSVQPTYEFDLALEAGDETTLDFPESVTGVNWNFWFMSECIVGGVNWKPNRKARIVGNVLGFTEIPFTYGTLITIRVRRRGGVGNLPQAQVQVVQTLQQ